MNTILISVFAFSVLYAVLGNVIVYLILVRRGVPARFFWSGTPGYLYRICVKSTPPVDVYLRHFSYSTNVAFLIAVLLGLYLIGSSH